MAQRATGVDDSATASESDNEEKGMSPENLEEHRQRKKNAKIERQRNARTMGLEYVHTA